MAKLIEFVGKFGKFSFPDNAERAAVSIQFPANAFDHELINKSLSKKELTGELFEGDADPGQKTIAGVKRFSVTGPFKSGKVGYDGGTDQFDFSVSFAKNAISADDLLELSGKKAYFVIKSTKEIKKTNDDKNNDNAGTDGKTAATGK